jgi:tRNA U38,U39,U40 pseudouridine synthase TruA
MVGNRKESCYARCGRTNKGVSATGQVVVESLLLWRVTQTLESNKWQFDICFFIHVNHGLSFFVFWSNTWY